MAAAPISKGFCAYAQRSATELSFEVATVKPVVSDASHPFNPHHFGPHVNPAGASYWHMTLALLIGYAYGVEFSHVRGPEWTSHDGFDVEARFPEGPERKDDRTMLQNLLRDRFRLAFHIEKRELESYALVVGKGGAKLRPSLPDPARPNLDARLTSGDRIVGDSHAKPEMTKNADGASAVDTGTQTVKFDPETSTQHWEFSKMPMRDLVERLSICVDSSYHKIVDETEIKGNYQVAYDCPSFRPPPRATSGNAVTLPPDPQGTYALTQSLDALGLKLEKRMVLQDVYVIDHVERPSEN